MLDLLYNRSTRTEQGITPGTISELVLDGFLLEIPSGELVSVVVTVDTRMNQDVQLEVGTTVFVFGEVLDGTVTAIGVKLAPNRTEQLRHLKEQRPGRQFDGRNKEYVPEPPPENIRRPS